MYYNAYYITIDIAIGASMKSVRTSVSLPHEQHQTLQKLAEENGLSVSWVIRQAIGEFLSKHQKFKPLSTSHSKVEEDMNE